jgi:hypothetical protein
MLSLHRKNFMLRVLGGAAALILLVLIPAAAARADGAYTNPFAGDNYYTGRTDMGVDFCLTKGAPIRAIGDGVVVGINRDWFDGQPYIWYQLTNGPQAGRYVYVAEQIWHLAHVGQTLQAGDVVARYAPKGTCIETGWGTSTGWTLAQTTTGYHEGQRTVAGVSFAHFLLSLGVQGPFELVPSATSARAKHKRKHKKPAHKKHPITVKVVPVPVPVPATVTGVSPVTS